MDQLNDNVIIYITDYLDVIYLCKFGSVCKRFRQILIKIVSNGGIIIASRNSYGDVWITRRFITTKKVIPGLIYHHISCKSMPSINAFITFVEKYNKCHMIKY